MRPNTAQEIDIEKMPQNAIVRLTSRGKSNVSAISDVNGLGAERVPLHIISASVLGLNLLARFLRQNSCKHFTNNENK